MARTRKSEKLQKIVKNCTKLLEKLVEQTGVSEKLDRNADNFGK